MGSGSNVPAAPDFAKLYKQGLQTQIQFAPKMAQKDLELRQRFNPQYIEEQQREQDIYGPKQIQEQLSALQQMDPTGTQGRQLASQIALQNLQRGYVDPRQNQLYGQLTGTASSQLAHGTQLDPASLRQVQQTIAGRQAGLSNQGNAADMAAAVYTGQRGQQLLQQRQAGATSAYGLQAPGTQAMAQMLTQPSVAQYANQIQGVSAPVASEYVNPQAGYQGVQFGLQNYQNQLAQNQLGGGGSNPWMGALQGAGAGASYGSNFGAYGAAGGALTGGVLGYLGYPQLSDERAKENIVPTGETTRDGIAVVEFNYLGGKKRFRGVTAQDTFKKRPDAVFWHNGYLAVYYSLLGIKLEEI